MNYKMFKIVNNFAGRYSSLDKFMILISNKSYILLLLILLFMSFRTLSYKKITLNSLISVGVCFSIGALINFFYYKPRPFVKRRVQVLLPPKLTSSFPSKHTLFMFAVSTSIFLYKQILGSILLLLSVLTGISRIWVGHHYPSDIIGSAIISSLMSLVIDKLSFNKSNRVLIFKGDM